ncbi:hypothetical protein K523DRAFT_311956 [Schizophyllum commune Tattone D]|nr:hypothetical protein K523DRAFT_311956 [Schizophyllum commune Tattone D]
MQPSARVDFLISSSPHPPHQDERLRYADKCCFCLLVTHTLSEEYLLRLLDEDGGIPAHLNASALKALDEAPVPDAPGTGGDEALEKKWRETHPLLPNPKTGVCEEYRLKDVLNEFERTLDYALLGPGYRWPSQGIYRGRISLYLRDPRTQKIRPYTDAEIGDEFRRRRLIEVEIQRRTPKKVDLRAFLESTYQKIHANDYVDSEEDSGSETSAESYDSHPEKSWTTKQLLNIVRTEVLEELDRLYHGDGSYSDPAFEDIDIPAVLDVIEDAAKRGTKKRSK